jgi:hypothetical protein
MRFRSQTGAFAGFKWVLETRLCEMLINVEKSGLTGQYPVTGRVQL